MGFLMGMEAPCGASVRLGAANGLERVQTGPVASPLVSLSRLPSLVPGLSPSVPPAGSIADSLPDRAPGATA